MNSIHVDATEFVCAPNSIFPIYYLFGEQCRVQLHIPSFDVYSSLNWSLRHRKAAPSPRSATTFLNFTPACVSAWGPDADRHRKYLV